MRREGVIYCWRLLRDIQKHSSVFKRAEFSFPSPVGSWWPFSGIAAVSLACLVMSSSPEGSLKKKPKMATDHHQSKVLARTKDDSTPSVFHELVPQPYFVDKTLLISSLFTPPSGLASVSAPTKKPMMIMTGPRRFGKTVNLASIADFVELEVDQEGQPLTKKNLDEDGTTVDDTPNYHFFSGRKLKIMEDQGCVQAHFGKYPVIKVNFLEGGVIQNLDDARNVHKVVVHEAYKRHRYLYKSSESGLEDDEKEYCQNWCHSSKYKEFDNTDVSGALRVLSRYLYEQFGRRVFILVDEFDSVVTRAVSNSMEKEVLNIAEMNIIVLGNLLKDNPYVGGAFITGILDLSDVGLTSLLSGVNRHRFSEADVISDYYGFTEKEVKSLLHHFMVEGEAIGQVQRMYNGYHRTDGEKIYNPFAVVQFLETHKLDMYWVDSGYVKAVENALTLKPVKDKIVEMLVEGQALKCTIIKKFSLSHLVDLQHLSIDAELDESYFLHKKNLIFNFLLRLGYLTYFTDEESAGEESSDEIKYLSVPKNELRQLFKYLLEEHYKKYDLDSANLMKCVVLLKSLFSMSSRGKSWDDSFMTMFKSKLLKFAKQLTSLIQGSNVSAHNESTFQNVVACVAAHAKFLWSTENYTKKGTRNDVMFYMGNRGAAVQLKYKHTAKDALLDLIVKEHYAVYDNALKNVRGAQITTIALIGLNLSDEKEVSIRWLPTTRLETLLKQKEESKSDEDQSLAQSISEFCKKDKSHIEQCMSMAFEATAQKELRD